MAALNALKTVDGAASLLNHASLVVRGGDETFTEVETAGFLADAQVSGKDRCDRETKS